MDHRGRRVIIIVGSSLAALILVIFTVSYLLFILSDYFWGERKHIFLVLDRIARLACPASIRVWLVHKASVQIAMLACKAAHLCTYLAAFDVATRNDCAFVILCDFLVGAVVKISLIARAYSHLCHRMVIAHLVRFEFFMLG